MTLLVRHLKKNTRRAEIDECFNRAGGTIFYNFIASPISDERYAASTI